MRKSPDAFRTISEVAEWLDVPTHVLRFWESKFSQIKPVKRAGGRRYYRPADMELIGGIKALLHDDGQTIRAVQKILSEKGVKHVAGLSKSVNEEDEAPDENVIELTATEVTVKESVLPEGPIEPEPVEEVEQPVSPEAVEEAEAAESAPDLIDLMGTNSTDDATAGTDTSVDEPSPAPAAQEVAEEEPDVAIEAAGSEDGSDDTPQAIVAEAARETRIDLAASANEPAEEVVPVESIAPEPIEDTATEPTQIAGPVEDEDVSVAGLGLATRLRHLRAGSTHGDVSDLAAHRAALIALRDRVSAHLDS